LVREQQLERGAALAVEREDLRQGGVDGELGIGVRPRRASASVPATTSDEEYWSST